MTLLKRGELWRRSEGAGPTEGAEENMRFPRTINSLKEMQETNRTAVLRVLFSSEAPLTRGEIAEKSGLSAPTITRLVRDLLNEGIVVEVGKLEIMQGRHRELLQINYEENYILGFEVNESFVHGVVCDLKGQVRQSFTAMVRGREAQAIAGNIQEIMQQINSQRGLFRKIIGIGLSISGIVDPHNRKVVRSNTMGWENIDVTELFPQLDGMTLVVENDANAALLGEVWLASAHEDDQVVYIIIGEGAIGASLLVDGQLTRGSTLMAGEISHLPVQPGGKLCACGNSGCLETYVSLERLEQEFQTMHRGGGKLLAAYKSGDELAERFVAEAAEKVAMLICTIVCLVNPSRVIIGGSWIEAGERFLDLITQEVGKRVVLGERRSPQIAYSKLYPHAGVLGAVGLVIDELLRY